MKSKILDQFYTNPLIAKQCISVVEKEIGKTNRKFYLEPAAGTGSFSSFLPNCVAIDLDPKKKGVKKRDFLLSSKNDLFDSKTKSSQICVIGNPPFGKNSSLAVKFFNHAAKIGETIAFIVPKTFRKKSVHEKLNKNFWLVLDQDLPKDSFIHNDQPHDTPCCFQIWQKRDEKRVVVNYKNSSYVEFVKKDEADFAVRRVGGRAGKAMEDVSGCAEVSHYFIKVKIGNPLQMIEKINSIDFSKIVNSTAGVRSLSKGEFIEKIEEVLKS